jgi:hypothetical protein
MDVRVLDDRCAPPRGLRLASTACSAFHLRCAQRALHRVVHETKLVREVVVKTM